MNRSQRHLRTSTDQGVVGSGAPVVGWVCLARRLLPRPTDPFAKPPDCEDVRTPQRLPCADGRAGLRHTHPKVRAASLAWVGHQYDGHSCPSASATAGMLAYDSPQASAGSSLHAVAVAAWWVGLRVVGSGGSADRRAGVPIVPPGSALRQITASASPA